MSQIRKVVPFYKFEERNSCPKCHGQLYCVGVLNHTDFLRCEQCTTTYSVEAIYEQIEDCTVGFFGYSDLKEEKY